MTLTACIPSLRRSLPDPLATDRWPAHTSASTTDVVVSGVSMLRLAELCDTPCVHNAAATIPGTGGRASDALMASVVVLRVTEVRDGRVVVDGHLEHCHCVLSEARLIGRASTAHSVLLQVGAGVAEELTVALPSDLAVGDLLAVPCSGMTVLRDLA